LDVVKRADLIMDEERQRPNHSHGDEETQRKTGYLKVRAATPYEAGYIRCSRAAFTNVFRAD
jgi:hypothetical protein